MRYAIYDDEGDLYAYATSRKDADKAARECGGSVVDQQRKGLEGPFRTYNNMVVYYDPREGLYYDPASDVYLPDVYIIENPSARRNPEDELVASVQSRGGKTELRLVKGRFGYNIESLVNGSSRSTASLGDANEAAAAHELNRRIYMARRYDDEKLAYRVKDPKGLIRKDVLHYAKTGEVKARNPRPTGLPDIEGGNAYFTGAYRAAVMQASSIPKGVDKEYARGWRTGMKIAKDHPAAVAYAQGVYEVEQDIPRAGQAMIEHVREQEQRAALGGVDKRRNPHMTQKRAKQLLGKMPSNITLDINGHDVRRVGPEHYVIGGKRCSTSEAAKKVAK